MAEFVPAYSPVVPWPTVADAREISRLRQMPLEKAMALLHAERNRHIELMEHDPLRYGYVPPIWELCFALLDLPWCEPARSAEIRQALGFEFPVTSLLVLGGNRSSKTEMMSYVGARLLHAKERARIWMFHQTGPESCEYHHALHWKYLPPELRKKTKTETLNISYTQKLGFTASKYVLPNRSEAVFKNYSQDIRNAIEGGEIDAAFPDELIPVDWIKTLEFRIVDRNGFILCGFTPVDGYSPTVSYFCDGATPVREMTAWLLPDDGGDPLEHLALGLTRDEAIEVADAVNHKREPLCLPCLPQPLEEIVWPEKTETPPEAAGRSFEKVPRVLRCADPKKAVVYFYSSDNPFGNPMNVINKVRPHHASFVRERFYGLAEKAVQAKLNFDEHVHVIDDDDIPADGTNYHFVDPCSGRKFAMGWMRARPEGLYIYREWPGNYYIPGIGVPGPWALPSDDAKRMDGKPGEGQKDPNWGLAEYKREIARLEGWEEYERYIDGSWQPATGEAESMSSTDIIRAWSQYGKAKEKIHRRYMDARFANVKGFEEGGMVTLLEKFDEMGITFYDTSSGTAREVDTGVTLINDALAYDRERELSFFNRPQLYIASSCVNFIFAFKIYTGADGQKGAVKDFVDLARWMLLKRCVYVEPASAAGNAGYGCY